MLTELQFFISCNNTGLSELYWTMKVCTASNREVLCRVLFIKVLFLSKRHTGRIYPFTERPHFGPHDITSVQAPPVHPVLKTATLGVPDWLLCQWNCLCFPILNAAAQNLVVQNTEYSSITGTHLIGSKMKGCSSSICYWTFCLSAVDCKHLSFQEHTLLTRRSCVCVPVCDCISRQLQGSREPPGLRSSSRDCKYMSRRHSSSYSFDSDG